jgi:hypothetical protein
MNRMRQVFSMVLLVAASASLPLRAEGLHEKLTFLEPLLGRPWQGEFPLPDGKRALPITQAYEALWNGKVIHYTRSIPDFPFFLEGYIYWDVNEQKVCLMNIDSRGNADRGIVTLEEGKITVRGRVTMNGTTYDYRNTFEVSADGTLTDRWFDNAMGSWQPGHVVVFTRGKLITKAHRNVPADARPAFLASQVMVTCPPHKGSSPCDKILLQRWLQSFLYRTQIRLDIFIAAGAMTVFVALMTVSCQSLKAATAKPVDSLRHE